MIKPRVKVDVKTLPSYTEFLKQAKKMQLKPYVSVGLNEDAGNYPDGESVINVGLWNEFGTRDIPQRPWLRSVVYGKENEINNMRRMFAKKVASGELTVAKALEFLGDRIVVMIQNQITGRSPFEENKPETIAAKARAGISPPNRPLYETGLLGRSVSRKVHNAA